MSRPATGLALAALLLALPAGGCVAAEQETPADAEETDVAPPPDLETGVTLQNAAGHAALEFRAGEPITVIVTLRNRAATPRSLTLPTSQTHDCIIYGRAGGGRDPVWRHSQGRMFAQVLTELTLAAGESRSFTATWNQTDARGRPVAPGDYQVVGLVPGGAPGCRAEPVDFTIRPATAPAAAPGG